MDSNIPFFTRKKSKRLTGIQDAFSDTSATSFHSSNSRLLLVFVEFHRFKLSHAAVRIVLFEASVSFSVLLRICVLFYTIVLLMLLKLMEFVFFLQPETTRWSLVVCGGQSISSKHSQVN